MAEDGERPLAISRSGVMNMMKMSFRTSVQSITDEKLSLLRSIFAECDKDKSGSIDHDEMREMLFRLGLENTEEIIENLFKKMDSTNAGSVNFFEFMKGMPSEMLNQIDVRLIKGLSGSKSRDKLKTAKRVYDQDQIKAVRKLFSKYDKDGSGTIDPEEFVIMIGDVAPRMTHAEIEAVMKSMDTDGDGTINFMEFLNGAPEWLLNTVLINSPKPSRAPIPVFLHARRKLRTTDDNFKTILACFEEVDTNTDGIVEVEPIIESLTRVLSKIFGKDKVDGVRKFFGDPNLEKIAFKEFATFLEASFETTDFQKFEIKKYERMLAKKVAAAKTPKKQPPPTIHQLKSKQMSHSLNFVQVEKPTEQQPQPTNAKMAYTDFHQYQKGGVLSKLLGQKSLTINTFTSEPTNPPKPIPVPMPSQVIDVGTSMTPPGSPQSTRRVRYLSVGDEDIDKKVTVKPDNIRRSKSFSSMETMTENHLDDEEEEEPGNEVVLDAPDEVQRQIEEYQSQIDSLQDKISALLKMLKTQKQEQDAETKKSVNALRNKIDLMQGQMDELERENIRSLTRSASTSTDSVVEAVKKAMLTARLNHRVKSLESRSKELEKKTDHLRERKDFYKSKVKPTLDEREDLLAKIELLEEKIRAKDAKIHAMIDHRVELEDERDRKDTLIENLSKSELQLMEKLDRFGTKLIEVGVNISELYD